MHGDGSLEAYLGRIKRKALEPPEGQDAISVLRKALLES